MGICKKYDTVITTAGIFVVGSFVGVCQHVLGGLRCTLGRKVAPHCANIASLGLCRSELSGPERYSVSGVCQVEYAHGMRKKQVSFSTPHYAQIVPENVVRLDAKMVVSFCVGPVALDTSSKKSF